MSPSDVFDVFLSHSSLDKDVVVPIAERLRSDGLRVWLDDWVIQPGDSIPSLVETGLEQSLHLVLCMSAQAFGSDWAQLEAQTFRFRDPLNRERRLIPLRLDDAPIKGSLAQFKYIDWRGPNRDDAYRQLLRSCQRVSSSQPSEDHRGQNEADLRLLVGVAKAKKSEWDRLQAEFEREASQYYDLKFKVYEVASGRPLTDEIFPSPNHAISLWQFIGDLKLDDIEGWVTTTKATKFGLTGAALSVFGVVMGDQAQRFVKMAIRAASCLSDESTNLLGIAIMKSFTGEGDLGKPVFVANPNGLAKWLNLMLVATTLIHPDRLRNGVLTVDPFAASLTIFDYLA